MPTKPGPSDIVNAPSNALLESTNVNFTIRISPNHHHDSIDQCLINIFYLFVEVHIPGTNRRVVIIFASSFLAGLKMIAMNPNQTRSIIGWMDDAKFEEEK